MKRDLTAAAGAQDFIADAGLVVGICADLELCYGVYGRRGRDLYAVQDCAAAAENILLKAAELGLASCWIGAFDDGEVARVLETKFRPQALLAIGKAAEEKPKPRRREGDEIIFFRNG
jgi:nitroreductase